MMSVLSIKKQLWHWQAKRALKNAERSGEMPILVHQMGKVGSTTVFTELQKNRTLPRVFQTHFISQAGLAEANQITDAWGREPTSHLKMGARLTRYFENREQNRYAWRIATIVRDPIARQLSDVFQNPEIVGSDLDQTPDPSRAVEYLMDYFINFDENKDYMCRWFEREIIKLFKMPVYDQPFSSERKYQLIENDGIRLLVFRIEDYSDIIDEGVAFNEWLEQDVVIHRSNANRASDRDSFESYRQVKDQLKIPMSALEKIYDTKYARHFYADRREELIRKWSS